MIAYGLTLSRPALLDDADATHAQAAWAMLQTGDWVTLRVDGVRYLEKAPLPYWLDAISLHFFAPRIADLPRWGAFAIHLPVALSVLALAMLGSVWAKRAFAIHPWGERAGTYTGLFVLTAVGMFLFTRIFLPDALLSFLLGTALYCAERAFDKVETHTARYAYCFWIALALAVLTKGLLALVLVPGALLICAAWSREWRLLRKLRPLRGVILFLAIASPWHVLAGLRNTGGAQGHGFFWFYFINEHVLRFLGRRIPRDYNKVPALLYWLQHLVWLFPWSPFLPVLLRFLRTSERLQTRTFEARSVRLLLIFTMITLLFFSLSTNQEYYTLPVYLPVLLLTGAAIAQAEYSTQKKHLLGAGQAVLSLVCITIASALAWGLWQSRHLGRGDLASLLAHRSLGSYTLATSHLYDLTTSAMSALQLPAVVAMLALAIGGATSWLLRGRGHQQASTITLVAMTAVFFVAAQMALTRFAPILSSADFAATIQRLEATGAASSNSDVLLFGDQAEGSSISFYLGHSVGLVNGRSTSMLFGSSFPDAPAIFFSNADLRSQWGRGTRKLLFVPADHRAEALGLVGESAVRVADSAGKLLLTDRPLDVPLRGTK